MKNANSHPKKVVTVNNYKGLYANSHPYKVEVVGGEGLATEDWVNDRLQGIARVVEELPIEGEPAVTYFVLKESTLEGNIYDEYMWLALEDGSMGWEYIGASDALILPLYDSLGNNTDGAITQKAATDAVTSLQNQITDSHVLEFTSAQSRNGLFRGKDLTNIYTINQLSDKVASGSFEDLYIGDYITKSITHGETTEEIDFVIAGFDYYLNSGDAEMTRHHIVFIPRSCFTILEQMNSSNTTSGGYWGSAMNSSALTPYLTGIVNAFGDSHVLSFRELFSTAVNSEWLSMAGANFTGASSAWAWHDTRLALMNEIMVYGTTSLSSSFYDVGNAQIQLPLFRLAPNFKVATRGKNGARQWWWLRSVASSTNFCNVSHNGNASSSSASARGGVRPYFLFA